MWRAVISSAWYLSLVCELSLIWLPTDITAETLNLPRPVNQAPRPDEPFGLPSANVTTGALLDRWLKVEGEMEAERLVVRMCEENRASCASRAALQFLSIIDSGRTSGGRGRLGKINCAINLSIRPMSDLSITGEEDVWSSPLTTLGIGGGDCEDYAIAKFSALQEAGVSP
jgi:predicted transglutaminase-like cysteine proteinase